MVKAAELSGMELFTEGVTVLRRTSRVRNKAIGEHDGGVHFKAKSPLSSVAQRVSVWRGQEICGRRCACAIQWSFSREFRNASLNRRAYLTGREPLIRMSTSLRALCCQSGPEDMLETPIRARSRSNGSRSFRMSPLVIARFTSALIALWI